MPNIKTLEAGMFDIQQAKTITANTYNPTQKPGLMAEDRLNKK